MIHSASNHSCGVINRILILGGGITGWAVAAGLANGLRGLNVSIMLVDDAEYREQDNFIEASTPSALAFHKLLGINERDLIKKTGASYKLATRYNAWAIPSQDYFLPFSAHGFMLNRIEFPHYVLSQMARVNASSYDVFALSAVAAKLGRFQHPSADENSLYSTLDYALQLPCEKYALYLQNYAQQLGVEQIHAGLKQVFLSKESGNLESVLLENIATSSSSIGSDGKISADLFIDCSGGSARLIAGEYSVDFIQNQTLTANSSMGVVLPTTDLISPTSSLSAAPAGWVAALETQDYSETRYFFNEGYTDQEQAFDWLIKNTALIQTKNSLLNTILSAKCKHYMVGKRRFAWHKNCVALGESAGNLESFVVGKLHLVQSAVLRLLSLFPATANYELNRKEYNRLTDIEFDHLSDFHAMHYQLARSNESQFWSEANAVTVSDRNQYRLALFMRRGLIPFYENETVSAAMWTSFLLGNHLVPKGYDPLVDGINSGWIDSQLNKMQRLILNAAQAMPPHSQYLKRLTMVH